MLFSDAKISQRKYWQIIYLTKDFYPEYMKNARHSTIKKINCKNWQKKNLSRHLTEENIHIIST